MAQQTQNLFTAVRTLKFRELSGDPKTFDIYDETDPSVTGVIECSMTNPEDKETLYLEIQYPKGISYAMLKNIGIDTTPTVIWRENAPKDKWDFLVEPKSSSNVALDSWLVKKKEGILYGSAFLHPDPHLINDLQCVEKHRRRESAMGIFQIQPLLEGEYLLAPLGAAAVAWLTSAVH